MIRHLYKFTDKNETSLLEKDLIAAQKQYGPLTPPQNQHIHNNIISLYIKRFNKFFLLF